MQICRTRFSRSFLLLALLSVSSMAVPAANAADPTVTVAAGEFDRRDTPVTFAIPAGAAGGAWELRDEAGAVTPVQADAAGRATFILKELKAGQTRTYHLQPAAARAAAPAPAVSAEKVGGAVKVSVRGREVFRYQGEKTPLPEGYAPEFQRGGYIHPVYTPAGVQVTDDYPKNHKHHHGVWSPWTKTEFEGRHPDFWNMGTKTGTVEFVSLDGTWSGAVFAGLGATHGFVDLTAKPQPKAALNETWEVRVYDVGSPVAGKELATPYRLFDWQSTQTTAGDSPLTLPKYHYGGLGFRGHGGWDGGPDKSQYLTSEGKTRKDGNDTRARWVRASGPVGGKPASVAILCHPDNFRFPQPVRIHPSEPFVCYAPQSLGEFKIEPGKPYVMKYRFVTADGDLDKAEIERLWNDYANPPAVTVK